MPILRTRILSRFLPTKRAFRLPKLLTRHPYALFHFLNLLFFLPVFLTIPRLWINGQATNHWTEWRGRTPSRLHLVLNTWNEYQLPAFQGLDDPKLYDYLRRHPLVAAMASTDGKVVAVRDGDQLRPPGGASGEQDLARWLRRAIQSGEDVWNPSPEDNPAYFREMVVVCRSGPHYVVVRWAIGSAEVERFLRLHIGTDGSFRVGLQRVREAERPDSASPPWSRPPNLQAECPKVMDMVHIGVLNGTNIPYLREWRFVFQPSWADLDRFDRSLLRWRLLAYGLCGLIPAAIALGAVLHKRMRRYEKLEMDRLASMTHSLKTPLGVLKLRCDSIRLGQFDPIQTEVELLRISKEVDQLTAFINATLEGFQRTPRALERTCIPPTWFNGIAYDLGPIFELEGRRLDLRLEEAPALAHEPTLKAAVVTLLENALSYGRGSVILRTRRRGRLLQIQIKDQGEGLDSLQLRALGTPFTRFRTEEAEGFQKAGLGLGIFHLACTAQRENWGFRILSKPGHGVLAVLEVPLDRSAR